MKKYILSTLTILLSVFLFASCGDDDPEPTPAGPDYLVLRSTTPAEGAEVDAQETSVITCSFNAVVSVSASANITLNGTKVTAQGGSKTKMDIEIPVALESGKSYQLIVAEGSITDANNTKINKSFTLNFTTKKSGEQALPNNEAMKLTKKLGFGWNLGNHFDTSWSNETDFAKPKWGYWDKSTPTEALYKALAAAGVQTVRIPATWGPYQKNEEGYPIDADYMAEVKQNVLWAKAAGLIVVLNTHHDEYWMDAYTAANNSATNEAIEARIEATWKQIAEAFKNEGDYLILETFNELNHNWNTPTAGELRIQNEWNQLAVNTIRATGGQNATRWIAVPSYQASPTYALDTKFTLPTDAANKLIVAVHCYDPYSFTLQDPLTKTWGSESDKSNITKVLNKLKTNFIDKDIPCYLGEFGCSLHETDAENAIRAFYLEYFCRAAHFAGLAACLWDNHNPGKGPEHHSYFSHNDGSWMENQETIVKTMIKALTSTDESYTLESIKKK